MERLSNQLTNAHEAAAGSKAALAVAEMQQTETEVTGERLAGGVHCHSCNWAATAVHKKKFNVKVR